MASCGWIRKYICFIHTWLLQEEVEIFQIRQAWWLRASSPEYNKRQCQKVSPTSQTTLLEGLIQSCPSLVLAWPLKAYKRYPMSWQANIQWGFIEQANVSWVHWVCCGVEWEVEALWVLSIFDPMSTSLSLKVAFRWSKYSLDLDFWSFLSHPGVTPVPGCVHLVLLILILLTPVLRFEPAP